MPKIMDRRAQLQYPDREDILEIRKLNRLLKKQLITLRSMESAPFMCQSLLYLLVSI